MANKRVRKPSAEALQKRLIARLNKTVRDHVFPVPPEETYTFYDGEELLVKVVVFSTKDLESPFWHMRVEAPQATKAVLIVEDEVTHVRLIKELYQGDTQSWVSFRLPEGGYALHFAPS